MHSFPKKVKLFEKENLKNKGCKIITNKLDTEIKLEIEGNEHIQYFIDLPIEGHILGVLWILKVGKDIDSNFYEHSYGNRIMENEKKEITYSPYLFKPYFKEYQGWRDGGLKVAEEYYENKKDSLIIMLDIRRFYYSVNFTENIFNELINNACGKSKFNSLEDRLNKFVFKVIKKYSEIMESVTNKHKNILPIGFRPSSILANLYLDEFDKNVINRVNPSYYGRYVDDIIIVDKVEKNSKIYKMLNDTKTNLHKIIGEYFIECKPSVFYENIRIRKCGWKYRFKKKKFITIKLKEFQIEKVKLNKIYIKFADRLKDKLQIQEDKIKLLYFKKEGTKTLLDKFKSEIRKNSSEFRLLPEDKELFLNNYKDIYKLKKSDSINKLRGIDNVEIDKYELSKFIGKQLTIGNVVDDNEESKFYDDLSKIYDKDVVIKNYITWEATLSLCVINYRLDKFEEFFKIIKSSINSINTTKVVENNTTIKSVKDTLNEYLKVCIIRSLSLVWSKKVKQLIEKLYPNNEQTQSYINKKRIEFCSTRMCNKMLIPILIDPLVINDKMLSDQKSEAKRLNKFQDCLDIWTKVEKSSLKNESKIENLMTSLEKYKYHPYVITYQDLTRLHVLSNIKNGEVVKDFIEEEKNFDDFKNKIEEIKAIVDSNGNVESNFESLKNKTIEVADYIKEKKEFKSLKNEIEKLYLAINYNKGLENEKIYKTYHKNINSYNKEILTNIINVGNKQVKKLKIAVATTNLSEKNFKNVLTDQPVRTLERYNKMSEIINQAVQCKADILVLPENYAPYEWITLLEREAKKNKMAIITGVEHIKYNENVYNLIGTILPYEFDKYNYVYTNFRTKVTYSPEEKRQINGYRFKEIEGCEYNLFVWNNIWIPIYCCFEIASIIDRSMFYSLTDLFVAIEWNSDINYFSNIIESLSRDMHCYCVQVNSAKYGDSCIIKPSKTESKSILRTKGGENNSILLGEIDIEALRDFQIKEYELQKDDKRFKPTPPLFRKDSVILRQKNKLFKELYKYNYKTYNYNKNESHK